MAHGAAHDPAQHIAAALVRGQHAVGDQERGGAQVVGDDPVGAPVRPVGVDAGQVGDRPDEGAEQVDVVVVVRALQHRGDALEPHAGVDRGLRQATRLPPASCSNCMKTRFQISMKRSPSASGEPGGPPGICGPVVVEDFRARAARAGVAHLPEIVGGRDADDLAVGQAGDLVPQVEGLVVLEIDRDGQPLRRQPEFLGDQVPGELDGAVLEIIAEREIAEHLEEGVVARRIADIVEIVVLAAGAHAFLRRHRAQIGPLLQAGEDVLELHHAGIGEHQGRVVARHERRRRHHGRGRCGRSNRGSST